MQLGLCPSKAETFPSLQIPGLTVKCRKRYRWQLSITGTRGVSPPALLGTTRCC